MKHLRALLLALHLFAIAAMALPSASGGLNRNTWKDPTVQEEFAAWTARLNTLGWTGTSAELQDQAFDLVSGFERGRSWVLAPFAPYYRYCGTWQSWRMFVAPHRYPGRLHIDILEHDRWRPVYQARSAEHTWRGQQLDHDRFRSAIFRYAWPAYGSAYNHFTHWVTRQARKDFPVATQVRVRFWKYRTPSPEEVREQREPKGSFVRAKVRKLR